MMAVRKRGLVPLDAKGTEVEPMDVDEGFVHRAGGVFDREDEISDVTDNQAHRRALAEAGQK